MNMRLYWSYYCHKGLTRFTVVNLEALCTTDDKKYVKK